MVFTYFSKALHMSIIYSSRIYFRIQRNVLTFLPANPLNKIKDQSSFTSRFLMKIIIGALIKDYEPLIKNELLFLNENQKEINSLQSIKEIGNLLKLIRDTESIEGDIIELGIAGGGTTIMIARFLKKINSKRTIYGCDTFEGLPYEDKFSQQSNKKIFGSYMHSFKLVSENIKNHGVEDKIILIKGLFEDTLYSKLNHKKFSFVFIDCDLYDATKYCLEFVWPRLSQKGIIVFDDYTVGVGSNYKKALWGETKAINEFCATKKIKLILEPESMLLK